LTLSHTGERLAGVTGGETVTVWDTRTGQPLTSFPLGGGKQQFRRLFFSPDGRQLVHNRFGDEALRVLDVQTGRELAVFRGHEGHVVWVGYSGDGRRLASVSQDSVVKVWDAPATDAPAPARAAEPLALSQDGRLLALRRGKGEAATLAVQDLQTNQELLTLDQANFQTAEFSPDGRYLATAVALGEVRRTTRSELRVWELRTGKEPVALTVPTPFTFLAFSPDGRYLAYRQEGSPGTSRFDLEIQVWEWQTGRHWQLRQPAPFIPAALAFSPDGQRLASSVASTINPFPDVLIWDWQRGEVVARCRAEITIHALSFRADGRRLAGAGLNGSAVAVWDADTGERLVTLRGDTNGVPAVAFSPDGSRLATGSMGQTVKLWDARTGEETLTLAGPPPVARYLAFQPDGRRLISVSIDGAVKSWDATPVPAEREARDQAALLASSLFLQPLLREEVIDRLQADPGVGEPVRQAALVIARRFPAGEPTLLNQVSWATVKRPGRPAEEYRRALRQAGVAVAMEPDNGAHLNTLGVAQYRSGKYAEALETLTRAEQLNTQAGDVFPSDDIFRAMAHYQLGHPEEARTLLTRARELLNDPRRPTTEEDRGFLAEAEALLSASTP
jgi:WD40 repeat protein